ncbi:MAG TPA: hypothetical protein VFJ85_05575 [Acidimicrobiales bacterium]|nr:hypothetical protein [Acidimicrobiales bacterium]
MTTQGNHLNTGFAEEDRWNPPTPAEPPAGDGDEAPGALFVQEDSDEFERRWADVQAVFVDDPRAAVESADRLVAEVMQTLSDRFGAHKDSLEEQWSTGGKADTEELRQALRQYRSFFQRLLAA